MEEETPSPEKPSSSRKNSIDYTNQSQIIKLNIGGRIFMTTKLTLIGGGENFFVPLVEGDFKANTDKEGAYFIDRNGDYFAPILDFLRHRKLIIPDNVNREGVIEEANFYSIDLTPGICGDIKEGLYTSTNWILFIERDPDNPWVFGVTGIYFWSFLLLETLDSHAIGVEEKTKIISFQDICNVINGKIHWKNNIIFSKNGKVYIKHQDVK